MRPLLLLAAALLAAGLAAMAYAASLGQVTVAFVLVFPVVVGTGPWGALAGLLVMGGLVAGFLALALGAPPPRGLPGARGLPDARGIPGDAPSAPGPARQARVGGFVLLGPIPLAFGTTRGLALAMLALALAVLGLLLAVNLLLGGRA